VSILAWLAGTGHIWSGMAWPGAAGIDGIDGMTAAWATALVQLYRRGVGIKIPWCRRLYLHHSPRHTIPLLRALLAPRNFCRPASLSPMIWYTPGKHMNERNRHISSDGLEIEEASDFNVCMCCFLFLHKRRILSFPRGSSPRDGTPLSSLITDEGTHLLRQFEHVLEYECYVHHGTSSGGTDFSASGDLDGGLFAGV